MSSDNVWKVKSMQELNINWIFYVSHYLWPFQSTEHTGLFWYGWSTTPINSRGKSKFEFLNVCKAFPWNSQVKLTDVIP